MRYCEYLAPDDHCSTYFQLADRPLKPEELSFNLAIAPWIKFGCFSGGRTANSIRAVSFFRPN
ncbi:hypothetical protein [Laspinema olomoucense]|uniref:hypothetical protein n=1 Tax=Laspinema olomoucense TaxID=3231600 RepID=UPI0021BB0ADE|nr:hypothetical protein [Laspinema sp. D3c]MCT7992156.1 hypothetical protein [Laspinema sp. D3c]